ncbi:phage protein [Staphylococcus aureus]|nr:phage protein [Staphylococcus aureus]CPA07324.1 phage protein [Staphylococcus aureus]CPC62592.1 phage protein [Staphylococcus aureus]
MKIKVKKEMRLDELIKWARENPELSICQRYTKVSV